MPRRRQRPLDPAKQAQFIADVQREQASRQTTYREKALRLFPHVCARCGREFAGKNLRELTVHHKDNNHMNNPPDGSNWELLCLYCHDYEHQDFAGGSGTGTTMERHSGGDLGFRPFEGLGKLLKTDEEEPSSDR